MSHGQQPTLVMILTSNQLAAVGSFTSSATPTVIPPPPHLSVLTSLPPPGSVMIVTDFNYPKLMHMSTLHDVISVRGHVVVTSFDPIIRGRWRIIIQSSIQVTSYGCGVLIVICHVDQSVAWADMSLGGRHATWSYVGRNSGSG